MHLHKLNPLTLVPENFSPDNETRVMFPMSSLDVVLDMINNKKNHGNMVDVYAEDGAERHRLIVEYGSEDKNEDPVAYGPYLILAGDKGNMLKKKISYYADGEQVSLINRRQLFRHAIDNCTSSPAQLSVIKHGLGYIEFDVNGTKETIYIEIIDVYPKDHADISRTVPVGSLLSGESESATPHLVLKELLKLIESKSHCTTAYWTQDTVFEMANSALSNGVPRAIDHNLTKDAMIDGGGFGGK